jgi:hypothetical protein
MNTNPPLQRPVDDDYEDDWDPIDEEETLPPRPRRRLVTPLTAVFAAVVVAALGFFGGVQVQKHQGKGSGGSANGLAAGLGAAGARGGAGRGGGGGFGGGGGPVGGGATIGSVANKNGSTLYVKDADGNTIKVKTTSHSKINRTADSSVGAIHPGDTVLVQGTKSSSGTVTASQITATAAGVSGGLFGGFGAGGGAAPGGGAPGGGGTGGSGGAGGQPGGG